ncbi:MAG: hypothetical protein PHV06_11380 [bacterium]|nr:hypothetical protein [bacterium]
MELLVQDNPGSPDLVSALCFRYLNRNNTVKANTLAQSFHKISNQSPEINYILYLTTIDEKPRAEYIAQAFSLVSKTDEYLARAIFREYIGYLSVTDKITEIPNAAESFLGSHTIDASDPAWDFLLRMLQLNGSISILQRVLKDNQVLPQDRVLYNYCNLLSTKEDGVEVLKNFGKLNQYLEQEIFTGLNLYKKNNGYLPDEIDYIGKRPMDPLTYNYLLYERSVNKVDAVFQLYEPERYYLKFWKYSYLRGLNFSSL